MKKRWKFTLSCMSLLPAPLVVADSFYAADIGAAHWQVEGSVFECRLTQSIPRYGDAVFDRQAGEPAVFYLRAVDSEMAEGRALLTSAPPAWRHGMHERDLGYVDVARSERPVSLNEGHTRLVMAELSRGMMPTLVRRAWYSDEDAVRVAVSPVNFQTAHEQYQKCVDDLLPVNFSQIERSTVFWRANQTELDAASRRQLDDIVTYVKADPSVYSFQINGFTDTVGSSRDNLAMSRARAFAVHEYLVSRGVDEAMLETRYFGETPDYLIVPQERTQADRDRNRRVTLLIRRH